MRSEFVILRHADFSQTKSSSPQKQQFNFQDPSLPVRNNAGHVVCAVANTIAENYSELIKDGFQLGLLLVLDGGLTNMFSLDSKNMSNAFPLQLLHLLEKLQQTHQRRKTTPKNMTVNMSRFYVLSLFFFLSFPCLYKRLFLDRFHLREPGVASTSPLFIGDHPLLGRSLLRGAFFFFFGGGSKVFHTTKIVQV